MHVFSSHLPSGVFCSRPGTIMSASHGLFVTVRGAGGHGSAPHRARDPIVVVAQMILALQTTVTRTFDIFDPVVITVGKVSGGSKRNVIPDTASFEATVRRYSEESEQLLDGAIKRTLAGVAAAHGVDVEIRFEKEYPTTVNDPAEVEFAADVVRNVLGEERYQELPQPLSGSEDFSRVIAEVPGAFLVLGATPPGSHPDSAPMNHSPRADFDPAVLSDVAAVYAGLAARKLDALAEEATS
jgi:amidohydrolase